VDSVEVFGDAGGVVGLLRPVTAKILECPAADQERVGSAVLPVQLLEQVAVVDIGLSLWVEPVIQHLDRAVDGDVCVTASVRNTVSSGIRTDPRKPTRVVPALRNPPDIHVAQQPPVITNPNTARRTRRCATPSIWYRRD
jgi:hypothetical protein